MSTYTLKETSSGKLTLVYTNSRELRLHSGHDPDREAERAVAAFSAGRSTVIAVFGIGLGYHLEHLKRKYPEKLVCAVERDAEVVAITRKTYPHHLTGVPVITSLSDLSSIFENMDIAGFRGIAHYVHRPSYGLYKDFYDGIMKEMNQYISSKISDLLTRFEFEEKWVENILANVHHLFTSIRVRQLFGSFAGCPGVIVSAGPSLRKNVDVLRLMGDRALIISVDTALKVLSKRNIAPHIVMTLDAQKYSVKHFLGATDDRTALLADLVCFPAVVRSYPGRKIISTTSKYFADPSGKMARETTPLVAWIERYADLIGDIQSGGSVATSVFDFLLNLGCNPIILVGQDLAYTGREIHASGTYHNDEWLPLTGRCRNLDTINQAIIRRRKTRRIQSYGGEGEVITDFVLDLYRGWFEDSVGKVGVRVINATEGGARIKRTEEISLHEILEQCPVLDPTPGQILDRLLAGASHEKSDLLAEALRKAVDVLARIMSLHSSAIETGDEGNRIGELVNRDDIREILQPFLRKSNVFLTRYAPSQEDSGRIILKDIISAAGRLIPAMQKCLAELEGLSTTPHQAL